jgi:hypothetical protein
LDVGAVEEEDAEEAVADSEEAVADSVVAAEDSVVAVAGSVAAVGDIHALQGLRDRAYRAWEEEVAEGRTFRVWVPEAEAGQASVHPPTATIPVQVAAARSDQISHQADWDRPRTHPCRLLATTDPASSREALAAVRVPVKVGAVLKGRASPQSATIVPALVAAELKDPTFPGQGSAPQLGTSVIFSE